MSITRSRFRAATLAALTFFSAAASAAVGNADLTFGNGGITLVDFTPVLHSADPAVLNAFAAVDAQGRTWAAARVFGLINGSVSEVGLGLTRLTRSGQLDGSFGSAGRMFLPNAHSGAQFFVAGLRIGADDRAYVAYAEGDDDASIVWHACRIGANGNFDPAFYAGGCASATPVAGASVNDLQLGADGSVWMLGSARDTNTNRYAPVAARFDSAGSAARIGIFGTPGVDVVPSAGAVSAAGDLLFTGQYTPATPITNVDAVVGRIHPNGSQLELSGVVAVGFDGSGSTTDVGRCLSLTAHEEAVIGVEVYSGGTGPDWASARVLLTLGTPLDATYGTDGRTRDQIANAFPADVGNSSSEIRGCQLGRDGAFNLTGYYEFVDPDAPAFPNYALAIHRLRGNGMIDQGFGGGDELPGVFRPLSHAGTVLHYLRPAAAPRPRADFGWSVSNVPHTGALIIGGVSSRTDNSGYSDLAVIRVIGDGIFDSGME